MKNPHWLSESDAEGVNRVANGSYAFINVNQ
jgi:hypothetical protein